MVIDERGEGGVGGDEQQHEVRSDGGDRHDVRSGKHGALSVIVGVAGFRTYDCLGGEEEPR